MSDFGTVQLRKVMDAVSPDEKAVRLAAFKAILSNTPASIKLLSQQTGLTSFSLAKAIARLTELGLLVCDHAGDVIGSWGLTLVPTNHRLRISGSDHYTWCAADAVGIPAALGADATVTSYCFQCGEQLTIEIKQGEVDRALPQDIRLWIAEAEIGRSVVACT